MLSENINSFQLSYVFFKFALLIRITMKQQTVKMCTFTINALDFPILSTGFVAMMHTRHFQKTKDNWTNVSFRRNSPHANTTRLCGWQHWRWTIDFGVWRPQQWWACQHSSLNWNWRNLWIWTASSSEDKTAHKASKSSNSRLKVLR